MGTLFVIATPIGNLEDITHRALRVIGELDVLLCEDTRVTRRLLERYGLSPRVMSYREQVHARIAHEVIGSLRDGANIGIVSDAGTPCVSDPGARLVRDAVAAVPELRVIPIPGPSAVTAAVSVSGFPADAFVFVGFPPHKKGRAAFFADALDQRRTAVMYESPHRIFKALEAIGNIDPARKLCVTRELTKMHETVYRGTAQEIADALGSTSAKGEFVIVMDAKR